MNWQMVSDWLIEQWFGVVALVVSIVLSVYFYFIAKRDKLPCYSTSTTTFIQGVSSVLPDLKVSYQGDGEPVENVSVTRFTFWNEGRLTINKSDVAEPLEIRIAEPHRILDCDIIERSHSSNGFDVQKNREKSKIALELKYVDYREACVIQIVHTGTSNDDISFDGKIKGGAIKRVRRLEKILAPFVMLASALMTIVSVMMVGIFSNISSYLVMLFFVAVIFGMTFVAITVMDWMADIVEGTIRRRIPFDKG